MTNVTIRKTEMLKGEICAPPSKAYTQRMTIAAALAPGTSKISNPLYSDDTEATLRAVTSLGAKVNATKDCLIVKGAQPLKGAQSPIDCGESGATLRFMIPVAALASGPSTFLLGKSLEQRPMEPLLQSLKQLGADVHVQRQAKQTSIVVQGGGITGGKTTIRGDVSSQFISGLMFACPLATAETQIDVTPSLESRGYVKMTQTVLAEHGIEVGISENYDRLKIPPNQKYKPCNHSIPFSCSSNNSLRSKHPKP
jgi:3-phosphoshikimate 1-carboxyvinyltransferase